MGILSKLTKKSPVVKKASVKSESPKVDGTSRTTSDAYRVLIRPLVTEKSTELANKSQYVFEVAMDSNKISVANAIEAVYGIKPRKVNMINVRGKLVSYGGFGGKRKNFKKAVVILPVGKKITVFEGV